MFHFRSKEAKKSLWGELEAFMEEYRSATNALEAGEMEAIDRFPEECFRPHLGMPAPPRPPSPPTRPPEIEESEEVKRGVGRGPIPMEEVGGRGGPGRRTIPRDGPQPVELPAGPAMAGRAADSPSLISGLIGTPPSSLHG
jgi:hypothetical protein